MSLQDALKELPVRDPNAELLQAFKEAVQDLEDLGPKPWQSKSDYDYVIAYYRAIIGRAEGRKK